MGVLRQALWELPRLIYGMPRVCVLCSETLPETERQGLPEGICPECFSSLRRRMANVCLVCGLPVDPRLRVCPACTKAAYYFRAQRSCGTYEGQLKELVLRLKYRGERWLARPLGSLLVDSARLLPACSEVVPVPIATDRLIERGYNQASDLAWEVAVRAGLRFRDVLGRRPAYERQASLGRRMRWENLRNTVYAKRRTSFRGERVLLVDDVMTTGATLHESARVLLDLGASEVYAVTVARAVAI